MHAAILYSCERYSNLVTPSAKISFELHPHKDDIILQPILNLDSVWVEKLNLYSPQKLYCNVYVLSLHANISYMYLMHGLYYRYMVPDSEYSHT